VWIKSILLLGCGRGDDFKLKERRHRRAHGGDVAFRRLLLPSLLHGSGGHLHGWYRVEKIFILRHTFELTQPQLADGFAEQVTEFLKIVGAGEGGAVFPATDIERVGSPNAVGDLLLGPAPFLACRSKPKIGCSQCCLLDNKPLYSSVMRISPVIKT